MLFGNVYVHRFGWEGNASKPGIVKTYGKRCNKKGSLQTRLKKNRMGAVKLTNAHSRYDMNMSRKGIVCCVAPYVDGIKNSRGCVCVCQWQWREKKNGSVIVKKCAIKSVKKKKSMGYNDATQYRVRGGESDG